MCFWLRLYSIAKSFEKISNHMSLCCSHLLLIFWFRWTAYRLFYTKSFFSSYLTLRIFTNYRNKLVWGWIKYGIFRIWCLICCTYPTNTFFNFVTLVIANSRIIRWVRLGILRYWLLLGSYVLFKYGIIFPDIFWDFTRYIWSVFQ